MVVYGYMPALSEKLLITILPQAYLWALLRWPADFNAACMTW